MCSGRAKDLLIVRNEFCKDRGHHSSQHWQVKRQREGRFPSIRSLNIPVLEYDQMEKAVVHMVRVKIGEEPREREQLGW